MIAMIATNYAYGHVFCWYIDLTSGKLVTINQLLEIGLIQKLHLVPRLLI